MGKILTIETNGLSGDAAIHIYAAASRGAKVLDANVDSWYDKILLTELDIEDADKCVLGQLYGTYWRGLKTLHPTYAAGALRNIFSNGLGSDAMLSWSEWNGFTVPYMPSETFRKAFRTLNEAWESEILSRREKAQEAIAKTYVEAKEALELVIVQSVR